MSDDPGAGANGWHYELITLSIAFGAVDAEAFLGEPPHLVDERAELR